MRWEVCFAAASLGSAACSGGPVFVGWPDPAAGARSRIAALAHSGTAFEVIAAAVDQPIAFETVLSSQTNTDVELFEYDQDLLALGLEPGPITAASPPGSGELFSTPARALALHLIGRDTASWSTADPSQLALSTFRHQGAARCRQIASQQVIVPSTSTIQVAVPSADNELLLAAEDGRVFRVRADLSWNEVSGAPAGFKPISGFRDRAGLYWFGGNGGELWRGHLREADISVELVAQSSRVEVIEAIDGDPDAPEREIYAVTGSSTVLHYDGASFEPVYDFANGGVTQSDGGVVWLAPGEILAATSAHPRVLHLHAGQFDLESFPDATAGITVLTRVAGYGVIAAQIGGSMHQLTSSGWIELGASGLSLSIYAVGGMRDGFIAGGALGWVNEYVEGLGFCPPPTRPLLGGDAEFFVPLGDHVLAGGHKNATLVGVALDLLDRAPPRP